VHLPAEPVVVSPGSESPPLTAPLTRHKESTMSKDKKHKKAAKQKDDKKDSKKDSKRLCKWDKDDIDGELDKLKGIVVPAQFICRRCGRVAKESRYLCKPVEI
jgi:hypothetical protein